MGFGVAPLPDSTDLQKRPDEYLLRWRKSTPKTPGYGDPWWKFGVAFEWDALTFPDPHREPLPKKDEIWRIGIVQNELYDKTRVQYGGNEPIKSEDTQQLLDVDGLENLPFGSQKSDALSQKVLYGSAGWKIAVPLEIDGPSVMIPVGGLPLHLGDNPSAPLPAWYQKKDPLRMFWSLSVFKLWIVAVRDGSAQEVVVANTPPFTVMMWAKLPPPPVGPGSIDLIDATKVETGGYIYGGFVKDINWKEPKVNALKLRPSRGPGSPATITKPIPGVGTANDRAKRWSDRLGYLAGVGIRKS